MKIRLIDAEVYVDGVFVQLDADTDKVRALSEKFRYTITADTISESAEVIAKQLSTQPEDRKRIAGFFETLLKGMFNGTGSV